MLAGGISGVTILRLSVLFLVCAAVLAGCADKRITLTYAAPAVVAPPTGQAQPLTIYAFNDRRGEEGDDDSMRVGGIYGGYGNRLSKVMADAPWMQTLVNALAEAFKARGIPATVVPTPLAPGTARSQNLALSGDLKNFSTEARFTNSAHISGTVRLYAPDGAVLVEKELSERLRSDEGGGAGVFTDVKDLQRILNAVLAKFVERVSTDPEFTARLISP